MKKLYRFIVITGIFINISLSAMDWTARQYTQEAVGRAVSDQLTQIMDMYDKYNIDIAQQEETDRTQLMNVGLRALRSASGSKQQKRQVLQNIEAANYNLFQSFPNLRDVLEELMGL